MRTSDDQSEYRLENLVQEIVEKQEEGLVEIASGLISELLTTLREGGSQYKVLELLSDKEWHCRSCEGKRIASNQYAGGGGIQGLQRGTKMRDGLVIETKSQPCQTCGKKDNVGSLDGGKA